MDKLLPYNVAHYILGEFINYHHQFKGITKRATIRFEHRDWYGIQADAVERLDLYREKVGATTEQIRKMLGEHQVNREVWRRIKQMYAEDVLNWSARNIAETFYNSVYRHAHQGLSADEEMMFVLPSHESDFRSVEPIYRTYSCQQPVEDLVDQIFQDFRFDVPFEDEERDKQFIAEAFEEDVLSRFRPLKANRVEIIRSVFFRNKGAYLIGRVHVAGIVLPFVLPLLHNENGVYVDALLTNYNDLSVLFSYNRSYFLVDVDIPSEYVEFLKTIAPTKGLGELYNSLGLVKHGKTEFYRDFVRHMHSNPEEQFVVAPGIKGMVMSVFTLPSYKMVFKVIKDRFEIPKKTTREKVKEKYHLVSQHDRTGRMADSHEFENFCVDRKRFSEELLQELQEVAPSLLSVDEEKVEIKHLYIEKKMIPLNMFLENCTPEEAEEVVDEYGSAIKQLAAVNIFPGDMLLKNFGVTRLHRVVFYDYDEICFLTDCNFRVIPEARTYEEEMSDTPWYSVAENDIFPEEFRRFLIGNRMVRNLFFKLHGDIFDVKFWKDMQEKQFRGEIVDVFPYRRQQRFQNRFLKVGEEARNVEGIKY